MGATLSLTIEKIYATTTCTVKATLKVKSTSGSYNNDKQSGYIKIDGTKYSFSSTFKSNTTTTLATKSKSVARGTSARDITVKGSYATGVSAGTISVTKTGINIAALPKYTVTWNKNGGGGPPTSTSVSHGKTTTFPSSAGSRTGYDWTGKWGTSASGGTLYNKGATTPAITSARTYYAQWKLKTSTVNFYDGTTKVDTKTVTYGQSFTFPTYTKSGYKFLGWSTSSTSPTAQYAGGTQVTWTQTAATVNYYAALAVADQYYPPSVSNVSAGRYSLVTNSLASDSTSIVVNLDWTSGTYTGTSTDDKYKNFYSQNNEVEVRAKNLSTSGEDFIVVSGVKVGDSGFMRGELSLTSPEGMVFNLKDEYLITVKVTDKNNDNTSSNSASSNVVIGRGGYTVSVSSQHNAVAVFGIAENNDPGVSVYDTFKLTPSAQLITGTQNLSKSPNQVVIGRYNQEVGSEDDVDSNPLFVIGAGTSNDNRKNILTVDGYGDIVSPVMYLNLTNYKGSNWDNHVTSGGVNTGDPMLYRFGPICQLVWQTTPKTTTVMNNTTSPNNICCTIPVGLRPPRTLHVLSQGSGTSMYQIIVQPDGAVKLNRLRNVANNNSVYTDATTSMWFPINVMWITTELYE